MIVNKPQFDSSIIKPGMFIMFKHKEPYQSLFASYWNKGFITQVEPFRLDVVYYSTESQEQEQDYLKLSDQIEGNLIIFIPELIDGIRISEKVRDLDNVQFGTPLLRRDVEYRNVINEIDRYVEMQKS